MQAGGPPLLYVALCGQELFWPELTRLPWQPCESGGHTPVPKGHRWGPGGQLGSSQLPSWCLLEQGLEPRLSPEACAPFPTAHGGLATALVPVDLEWGPVITPRGRAGRPQGGRGGRKLSSSEASTRSRKLL